MDNRSALNSKFLQEKQPAIYEDFFSRCTLVISAPASFCWAGDYSAMEGGLTILQKLPLRTYAGIFANEKGKVEIKDFIYYEPIAYSFKKSELEDPPKTELVNFIKNYLIEKHGSPNFPGVNISILTEILPGCGLNFSGSFATALAIGLSLHTKTIKHQDLEIWQKELIGKIARENDKFNEVFRLAWKIGSIFHGGISSGSTSFTPFFDTSLPIIYWTEKRGSHLKIPKNIKNDYAIIDKIHYQGIRMEELFNFKKIPNWPIDFGLIYSGDIRTTATTHSTIEDSRKTLKKTCHLTQKIFDPLLKESLRPNFFKMCQNNQWRNLWSKYIDPLTILTLELLQGFKNIFEEGMASKEIKSFLNILNRYQHALNVLNLSSPILDSICFNINNMVRNLGDEYGAGAKIIGAGLKGDVLFAVAYHGLRDQIDNLIAKLNQETKEKTFLDHASWLDGREHKGVQIEQSLENGVYSKFISKGVLQIKCLNKNGVLSSNLYTLEEFEKENKKMDLVLDIINKKIYIKGGLLTSKNLRSASTTIKLLQTLIIRPQESISNTELPLSSYARDRNELQSKIISPLQQMIKKRLNYNLNLKISGGITNFSIKLDKNNFDIYLIENRF